MKNYLVLSLLFVVLCFTNCGKDDGGVDVFIPNLSNGFHSQTDDNLLFFLKAVKENTNESDVTGNYNNNGSTGDLEGHFKNYDITVTLTSGDDAGTVYTGKFIKGDPLKIQLHGTNNTNLTLIQF